MSAYYELRQLEGHVITFTYRTDTYGILRAKGKVLKVSRFSFFIYLYENDGQPADPTHLEHFALINILSWAPVETLQPNDIYKEYLPDE